MIFSLEYSPFFCNQHLLSLYNDGLIDDNSKMDREIPEKMARGSKTFPIPARVDRITCT
jgi:hypothetical protein